MTNTDYFLVLENLRSQFRLKFRDIAACGGTWGVYVVGGRLSILAYDSCIVDKNAVLVVEHVQAKTEDQVVTQAREACRNIPLKGL